MTKPLLCLDFDGVVHSYTSPWIDGATIPDPPVPGALTFIALALPHFRVAIYSTRNHLPQGIEAMKSWLKKHATAKWGSDAAEVAWMDMIDFPKEKPPAFLTIDDRAMMFTGPPWPSPEALLQFKPWNKR